MNAEEFHSSPFPIERWLKLAEQKLRHQYVLIADMEKRSARFFRRGVGYEPCPFQVAQVLISGNYVGVVGEHDLGMIYMLHGDARRLELAKAAAADDDEVLNGDSFDEDDSFSGDDEEEEEAGEGEEEEGEEEEEEEEVKQFGDDEFDD